jgi:protein tyrosine phosphatase
MLYGREACNPSQEWVQDIAKLTSTDQYIKDLVTCLQYVWTTAGNMKPKQVQTMNDNIHPKKHVIQLEYTEKDYCFLKRVPKRDYTDWKDKLKYEIQDLLKITDTIHRTLQSTTPTVTSFICS